MKKLFVILLILGHWIFPRVSVASPVSSIQFSAGFPQSFEKYLTHALEELFAVKGEAGSPFHLKIFGGPVDGEVYRKWFVSRVRKIAWSNDNCNVTARIDSEGEPGVIYISACVDPNPNPQQKFYWLSVLFHEARHLEAHNQFWKHQVCLDPLSSEVMACDQSPLSPYALEKIFSLNLIKNCLNCSAEFKAQAQEVFDNELNWRRISLPAQGLLRKDLSF